jgi:beta-glucanase (GH16 family)
VPATTIGTCDATLDEAALTAAGWTKIFEDNFETDLSKWNIWYGGAYNNELQLYQAQNMTLSSGILSIAAKEETVVGPTRPEDTIPRTFNFTSGRIECKTNVSANNTTPKVRMIARIKLPAGYGMWPAFWSYGDDWPTNGEIDILEAKGHEPFVYSTNYFYGRRAGVPLNGNFTKVITSNVSLVDCYHVYEVIWQKGSLTFLLDGQVVDTKTGGYVGNLFGKVERVTLNLAVGGDYVGNPPASSIVAGTMLVDYVKVFTSR